jgi:hypothetical protein
VKVLLVHNSYQHRGGEDIVYEQECNLLRSQGVEVIEYRRDNELPAHLSFTDRLSLARRTVWSDSAWREIHHLLASEQPDIVHVHNTLFRISPSVYWACHRLGTIIVCSAPAGSSYGPRMCARNASKPASGTACVMVVTATRELPPG